MTKYVPQLGDYVTDIENEEQFEAVIAKWKELTGKDRYSDVTHYSYLCKTVNNYLCYDWEGDIIIDGDVEYGLQEGFIKREVSVKDIVPELFESKPISPDDELTFTASAKTWAKIYAILGLTNGTYGDNLWCQLRDVLDPEQKEYDSNEFLTNHETIDFNLMQDQWLDQLFAKYKAHEQLEVEKKTIQDKIDELQKELESLG